MPKKFFAGTVTSMKRSKGCCKKQIIMPIILLHITWIYCWIVRFLQLLELMLIYSLTVCWVRKFDGLNDWKLKNYGVEDWGLKIMHFVVVGWN